MTKLYEKPIKSCPSENEIRKGLKEVAGLIPVIPEKRLLMKILNIIDLTSLNTTDSKSNIIHIAAICVYPNFVPIVKEKLAVRNVKIAAVAGSFPTSQTFRSIKIAECKMAIEEGADEIDIVMPVGAFLAKDYETVAVEIREIKKAVGDKTLKVIIESGLLGDYEQIFRASLIAMDAGADFIKTSTGKVNVSATPETAFVMCRAISDFYSETGIMVGFKPAGGIVSAAEALLYYHIVRYCLGEEWLNNSFFRIGASRLANNILSEIAGERHDHF
jgi:deoxyribose-phosphate aldolase